MYLEHVIFHSSTSNEPLQRNRTLYISCCNLNLSHWWETLPSWSNLTWKRGCGYSTVVDHTPQNQEVVGSNSVVPWAFFLPTQFLSGVSLVQEVQNYWCSIKKKPSCSAHDRPRLMRLEFANKLSKANKFKQIKHFPYFFRQFFTFACPTDFCSCWGSTSFGQKSFDRLSIDQPTCAFPTKPYRLCHFEALLARWLLVNCLSAKLLPEILMLAKFALSQMTVSYITVGQMTVGQMMWNHCSSICRTFSAFNEIPGREMKRIFRTRAKKFASFDSAFRLHVCWHTGYSGFIALLETSPGFESSYG